MAYSVFKACNIMAFEGVFFKFHLNQIVHTMALDNYNQKSWLSIAGAFSTNCVKACSGFKNGLQRIQIRKYYGFLRGVFEVPYRLDCSTMALDNYDRKSGLSIAGAFSKNCVKACPGFKNGLQHIQSMQYYGFPRGLCEIPSRLDCSDYGKQL